MKKQNKIKIAVVVMIVLILVISGIILLNEDDNIVNTNNKSINNDYIVQIKGEVIKPGLYYVSPNLRVNDIVKLALGFTDKADMDSIDLTEKVYDGMTINVLATEEENQPLDFNVSIDEQNKIIVKVIGDVVKPGYYALDENDRVIDAIEKAGGLLSTANTNNINFSQVVLDGQTIKINNKEEVIATPETNDKISINTATKEQLMTLPGIKDARATNIINYRNQNNGFKTIEEITNVSGISEAIFEQIKDLISL